MEEKGSPTLARALCLLQLPEPTYLGLNSIRVSAYTDGVLGGGAVWVSGVANQQGLGTRAILSLDPKRALPPLRPESHEQSPEPVPICCFLEQSLFASRLLEHLSLGRFNEFLPSSDGHRLS